MKNISLYVEQDTYLTRLHPFAKLTYILAAVSVPLIAGSLWMFMVSIGVSLCLLAGGKIAARVFPLIAFSFTIIATVFLIHGLFNRANQNVLFALGPLQFYREGIRYAAGIGLNILNMLLAFSVFVLSTKPAELVDDLEQIGFPPRFGYMISSVFQIIPQMEGNLFVRAKAFIPLIVPVVSSSLINTRERAIALEVRGFDSKEKKTFLTDGKMGRGDRLFMAAMVLFIVCAVGWRAVHVIY